MATFDESRVKLTSGAQLKSTTTSASQLLKVIDVSDQPLKSNVVRKGKLVPSVELDPRIVDAVISPDVIVQPGESPRVVSQSIPPGTKVARGASVDLVLAPRTRIPGGIFRGGHAGFMALNVQDIVGNLLVNDAVFAAVVDFDDPDDLPANSRAAITAALDGVGIGVVETDPTQDFAAAFRSLKGAAAFK